MTLTTVGLLAPHLTAENHLELLDQARHKSRREVDALAAALRPPAPGARLGPPAPAPSAPPAVAPTPPVRPPVVAPLTPARYRVQFTASAETHAKLRLAQDLLRHQIPDGDVAQVLDRALTVLVDALTKQKLAATERPRASRPPVPGSRHVPAAVRRTVWARDGGQCAFVSPNGRRCTERGRLEFHHVRPYAAGGPATSTPRLAGPSPRRELGPDRVGPRPAARRKTRSGLAGGRRLAGRAGRARLAEWGGGR